MWILDHTQENAKNMKIVKLTENEIRHIVKRVMSEAVGVPDDMFLENYDSGKLYSREYVVNMLRKGPKELKKYIKELPYIDCTNSSGDKHICTKVPEVIEIFIKGRY